MPNPQVCMFCRYRRTAGQGNVTAPCTHTDPKPLRERAEPGYAPGGMLASGRRPAPEGTRTFS